MNRFRLLILLVSALLMTGLAPLAAQDEGYFPTTEWLTSTPEAQGMDSAEIAALFAQFSVTPHDLDSMVVVRHGRIVAEVYAPPFEQSMTHQLWSASKSVMSALVGILLRDGHLESLDVPVLSLFPDRTFDNVDAAKEAMTVRHLLTMTSGLTCDMLLPGNPGDAVFASEDWLQSALSMPMLAEPGTEFHYCNANVYVLSALIHELTGMTAAEFAEQELFGPLGITDYMWEVSPQGDAVGASGLHLTTRDMAKFGYLYLKKGVWDGVEIVPADYVAESITTQFDPGWPGTSYGYLWWNILPAGTTMALGRAGQYIILAPEKDLMVVMTGGSISESLRPALQGYPLNFAVGGLTAADGALPENSDGLAQLEAQIAAITTPVAVAAPPLPVLAESINGQTFGLGTPITIPLPGMRGFRQPMAINALRFDFADEEQGTITLMTGDGEAVAVPFGLNGVDAVVLDSPVGMLASRGEWRAENEVSVWIDYVDDGQLLRLDAVFLPGAIQVQTVETVGGAGGFSVGMMMQQ